MGLLGLSSEDSLALAAGLLGNRTWQEGLSRGLLGVQHNRNNATQQQMAQLQLEQARKQMAEQEQMRQLAQQFQRPGSPGVAMDPRQMEGGGQPVAPQVPSFDFKGYAGALTGIDPMKGLALQSQLAQMGQKEDPFAKADQKDYTPESVQQFLATGNRGALVPYRKPEGPQVGALQHYDDGPNTLTYQFDGQKWNKVASSPKFKPESADKGEKAPAGYRWSTTTAGALEPIPGGPAAAKAEALTPKQKDQNAGIKNLGGAIDAYVKELPNFGVTDMASPASRAKMGTLYNNMMLQAKEAYNLGVLNGPDYEILQQVVTNPLTMKGAVTPTTAMVGQAQLLKELMGKMNQSSGGAPSGDSGVRKFNPTTGKIE